MKIQAFDQDWFVNLNYSVNAAAVIQMVTGMYFDNKSMVPQGMNKRFKRINSIAETLPNGYTIGDLHDAWLRSMLEDGTD